MEQMADAEHNVTVATLSAYINGSAAFEYPAAFVDTVTELHGRRPLPDPPLQALVAGLSLTNPGKLVVMAADKGMTLQGLAEMEAKDREAVCTAALGLQLPELQVLRNRSGRPWEGLCPPPPHPKAFRTCLTGGDVL